MVHEAQPTASCCRFEWVDGALTRAVEAGGWVLLRGANLAAPAVLDRLNSLLEPGGQLVLNEAGAPGGEPRVVRPHPDFRLILALDPRCEIALCHLTGSFLFLQQPFFAAILQR